MTRTGRHRWGAALALMLAALVLAVSACGDDGGGDGGGGGGSLSEFDLSGAQLTVGSKEFTEQLILGQITILALEAAGAQVEDQTGLEGSVAARRALTSGEIDMYWEYTGTAWTNYLNHDNAIPDEQRQYQQVKQEDLQQNNIEWLQPAPFNNTYAFAVRQEAVEDLGVEQISDFQTLIQERPEEATLCVGQEFANRPDGLPGVERAYNFQFPDDQVFQVGDPVVYQQVDQGQRCNFGSVFATDGRIPALDLAVIEDDQNFFPFFNPALNVRAQVLDQYPQLSEMFAPIAEALTTEVIQGLNARVDTEGEEPEEVARSFLQENGFIE